jgi:hypothetical protein
MQEVNADARVQPEEEELTLLYSLPTFLTQLRTQPLNSRISSEVASKLMDKYKISTSYKNCQKPKTMDAPDTIVEVRPLMRVHHTAQHLTSITKTILSSSSAIGAKIGMHERNRRPYMSARGVNIYLLLHQLGFLYCCLAEQPSARLQQLRYVRTELWNPLKWCAHDHNNSLHQHELLRISTATDDIPTARCWLDLSPRSAATPCLHNKSETSRRLIRVIWTATTIHCSISASQVWATWSAQGRYISKHLAQ